MSHKLSRACARLALFVAISSLSICAIRAQELSPSASPTPSPSASPQRPVSEEEKAFSRLEWRNIGPANMGGRIADIQGVPGNPNVVYVGTASGGIFKTTNAGVTWKPVFERESTISVGAMALEPGNPDVVWVGTGESAVRNSISFGDGVYKSTDGGKTWQHLGLRDTERISKILVSPRDPNTVYVGALGHAFGPNAERGVFMTTDGGRTWQKTLYIDEHHGVSDMDIDPQNPNIIYAGMWAFERKPWTHTSGSEKGGVFRSIDGGRTWTKLTNGLPKMIGRIGLAVSPSNPNVVYAIMEAKEGKLYRSNDKGETWQRVSDQASIVSRGFYYTHVRVDPTNENNVYAVASTLFRSIDSGRTFRPITGRTHVDYHAFWMDPKDPRRVWVGEDGGVAVSYDAGDTWEPVYNMAIGQFYEVHLDDRSPFYYAMGGLQDNGSWTGPTHTREPSGILNDDWRMVSFGDGFWMFNHPDDPDLYLSESQGGNVVRTDMKTREQQEVIPNERVGEGGAAINLPFRFNWNSPLVPSLHDKNTVYLGGNVLFRSTDFGKSWTAISPDLTTNDPAKQKDAGGPVAYENTGAEYNTTIISVAESPLDPNTIWAGTDDGNLQVTNDGGKTWRNLTKNVPDLKPFSEVTHVEPSVYDRNLVYATFDRHMLDDFRPYVYKSTDGGKTWRSITGDLPDHAYVHVLREDPKNQNLIYAGTELGIFASYTGGRDWIPLRLKNLPTVAVRDIKIHPRDNDIVIATHGRSLYVFDDATPIQQMTPQVRAEDVHLFDVRPALRYSQMMTRYGIGDKPFTGQNPPYGALITYYLKNKPDDKATFKMQIFDSRGNLVSEIARPSKEQGLNRVVWDLRFGGAKVRRPATDEEPAFFGAPRGPAVVPGTYTLKLTVGDKVVQKPIEVRLDPNVSVPAADLQKLQDMSLKLRDMQSATNTALRALDSLKSQLEFIERTQKDRTGDLPKDFADKLTAYKKQVDDMSGKLARPEDKFGGVPSRPQLIDRLGGLFFTIDGVNAAPTPAQQTFFTELQTEFHQKLEEVNRFITQTVPQMNDTLRHYNAPQLIPGKPIDENGGGMDTSTGETNDDEDAARP
ncbi:MAG: glycosyl hydrolase [Acidobacteriota bacterium]|nr:glycosyl hydrolase [Acidobacteriota bacterium]